MMGVTKEILKHDEFNVANAGGATAILIGVIELADALETMDVNAEVLGPAAIIALGVIVIGVRGALGKLIKTLERHTTHVEEVVNLLKERTDGK